jgi:hypothetical protein
MPGVTLQTWWGDITPLAGGSAERLGLPDAKAPATCSSALSVFPLTRTTSFSTRSAGCGTALGRCTKSQSPVDRDRHFADSLSSDGETAPRRVRGCARTRTTGAMEKDLWSAICPRTEKQLRTIPPFEFENWAVIALGGIPNKTQVGDMGIDGRIYPVGTEPQRGRKRSRATGFHGTIGIRSR